MLLKVMNVHDNWEIWDKIAHVTIQPLCVSFRDSVGGDPPGVVLEVGITVPHSKHTVDMVQLTVGPDEFLLDIGEPTTKDRWGKFITAEMVDGRIKTFAFLSEGYLMSDDGHTLESFNKR